MDDVAVLVQRLTARYRRRLILRAAAGVALGLSCAALLALRLQQSGMEPSRVLMISAGVLALVTAWQWRSIRRDRPAFGTIANLDRELGLHARLLTAVEFADVPNPPALYSRLLEETSQALPDIERRLPRVLDRPGAVLAAIALVLLLWPQADAHLQASARLQLAMSPPAVMLPETPPPASEASPEERGEPPPPQPGQQSKQDQQQNQNQSGSQNQQSQGGGSQDQPQHQQQQTQQGSSGDQSKESQANKSQQSKSGAQQPNGSKQSQQQSGQQQAGKEGKSGAAGEQASAQAKSSDQGNEKGSDRGGSKAAQLAAKGDKGEGDKAGMKAGSPSDAAQQQALKADIQQLLKELSSELKELQAEMDAKQSNSKEPSPLAGGATDPTLYEQSAKLDKASGSRLPVQLEVDTKPTTAPRRGGGTGQASKQASDALPQQEPESASLSDVRTTEQGQARHAIPPEYQPVFERLSPGEPEPVSDTSQSGGSVRHFSR